MDRDTWEAAQKVGAEHRSSRDGAMHNPANWRTYPFRSRIRCKICKRRMCGQPKAHPDRKTPTEHIYYVCQFNPGTPRHVAAAPDHPRTVQVREDFLRPKPSAACPPTPWAPAGNSASRSSSRTPPPPASSSTTGRPPPSAPGSSASPPSKTT